MKSLVATGSTCLPEGRTYQASVSLLAAERHSKDGVHPAVATSNRASCRCACSRGFLSYADLPEAERYLASDLSLNAGNTLGSFTRCRLLPVRVLEAATGGAPGHVVVLSYSHVPERQACVPAGAQPYLQRQGGDGHERRDTAALVARRCNGDVSGFTGLRIRRELEVLLKKIGEKASTPVKWCIGQGVLHSPLRSWIAGPLRGLVDCLLSEGQIRIGVSTIPRL